MSAPVAPMAPMAPVTSYLSSEGPLKPLVYKWIEKIRLAWRVKKDQFQDDAEEAARFFDGPYDWLYGRYARESRGFLYTGEEDPPVPTFGMTVNKASEVVQLFGPALYHRNPVRQVNARRPPLVPPGLLGATNPQMMQFYQQLLMQGQQQRQVDQVRAVLLEHYLNYLPTACDLKTAARTMVDEALIKGMGLLWTYAHTPVGSSSKLVCSCYDTVDNLVIDPDRKDLRKAAWIAQRCILPFWEAEQEFNLPSGSLRQWSGMESYAKQADIATDPEGDYRRRLGTTNDLIVIWRVYSKMGLGGRMSGLSSDILGNLPPETFDGVGDYCYLALCENCPFPLNLYPQAVAAQPDIRQLVQWPTPFWADEGLSGGWPFTPLIFHEKPGSLWPISHLKPALGELKFLNWAYSFLAGKIKTACRDFIAVAKSAAEELKVSINAGRDYTMLEVEALQGDIDKVVKFLQHPPFHKDIYEVIERVAENFEKRTGLTELMYGQTASAFRSAAESQAKESQMNVRPDDMANKVEDAMTDVARKEALCARWHLTGQDVSRVLGPVGTFLWDQLLVPSDPEEIVHSLEYRIEANSARKPNKAREIGNMKDAITILFAPLFQFASQTGNVGPVNGLITAWAKANDLDPAAFLLPPPPPPMPAPGGMGPPGVPPGAGGPGPMPAPQPMGGP